MEVSKPVIGIACFAAGVGSVYLFARIYRNRFRDSIAMEVTGKVSASLSGVIPGVNVEADQTALSLIQTNISYPVAEGVLNGLGI